MPVSRECSGFVPPELKFKKNTYPQSPNKSLPALFHTIACIGPRGSGKTHTAVQLLKAYEKDPPINADDGSRCGVRFIVISPTFDSNPVFTSLKNLSEEDVYRNFSDEVLDEILESIKHEKGETEKYREKMKLYRKWLKVTHVTDLTQDELLQLELMDFGEPEKPRYPNGCASWLVMDDLVGSEAYKSTGRSKFTNLLLQHRHIRLNIVMMCQSLKSLPRTIRCNVVVWQISRFGTRSHLPDLYEECGSALVNEHQFEELYDEATKDPYGTLVIDFTAPKERRFSASYKEILKILP